MQLSERIATDIAEGFTTPSSHEHRASIIEDIRTIIARHLAASQPREIWDEAIRAARSAFDQQPGDSQAYHGNTMVNAGAMERRVVAALETRRDTLPPSAAQWQAKAQRVCDVAGGVLSFAMGRTWGEGDKHWAARFEELNDAIRELRDALPSPPSAAQPLRSIEELREANDASERITADDLNIRVGGECRDPEPLAAQPVAGARHQWWCGGKEPCACTARWKESQL